MPIIRITNLRLRTIIGTNEWEREEKQDVVINITMTYTAQKAMVTDKLADAVDYKVITKQIIAEVENSQYYLLEKLTNRLADIILENKRIQETTVKVDKPFALRFSDSVSFELTKKQA